MDPEEAMRRLRDLAIRTASQDEQSELREEQLKELGALAESLPPGFEREVLEQLNLLARQSEVSARARRNLTTSVQALSIVTMQLADRVQRLERRLDG